MPFTARRTPVQPAMFSNMNVTPFIDVLLVLLVMFIMVIPIATHSLQLPLPNDRGRADILDINVVNIDKSDRLYWNGTRMDRQELLNQLASAAALEQQPVIHFDPDALASYDTSARTVALIKDSGVKHFAFVGNHEHRSFGKAQ